MQAAVGDRALVHPGAKDGADRAPKLRVRVLRKILAELFLHARLVTLDKLLPIAGVEVGVEHVAVAVLMLVEQFFEVVRVNSQHHVRIHGDEAAIGVIGEAGVAGFLRERGDGRIVEPEIEHGVHHARHRGARSGAHRHQQRIRRVAEGLAGNLADMIERCLDLSLELGRIGLAVAVEISADVRGDGEAGRYRQTEIGHLGEICALAAEEIAQAGFALGPAVAE